MIVTQKRLKKGFNELLRTARADMVKHMSQLPTWRKQEKAKGKNSKPITTALPPSDLVTKLNISTSLQDFIDQAPTFAPYSMILGQCEDQLPLIMTLDNPAPGSIMIAGDPSSGKRRLLNAVLKSAVLLNTPDRIQLYIITNSPEKYTELSQTKYGQVIHNQREYEVQKCIKSLSDLVDRRWQRGFDTPVIILAIDDLALFAEGLDRAGVAQLFKLFRHGPRYRIWTLVTLTANRYSISNTKLLDAFRTRIVGKIASIRLATQVTGDDDSPAVFLESGTQFCVAFGNEWLKFSIYD
jgi:hypothetical protein